jgi:hypothetical protein
VGLCSVAASGRMDGKRGRAHDSSSSSCDTLCTAVYVCLLTAVVALQAGPPAKQRRQGGEGVLVAEGGGCMQAVRARSCC